MQDRAEIDRLYDRIAQLETEVLLGRYVIAAMIQFTLDREPSENRQAIFNRIMGEARASAEIDGWGTHFDRIFEFRGDQAWGFVRKKSLTAPNYL